jgi:predicted nucleic acid-binding protein
MVVVDTCGWIEWLEESALAKEFESTLRAVDQLIVPTAVQMELHKWIIQHLSADRADAMTQYTEQCWVSPLTQVIALGAAEVAIEHRLSFADAVIYATALHHKAILLTSDAHFKDLPHVHYIKKAKP